NTTDTQDFTITLTGTNDAPEITGATSDTATEQAMGATTASGTITFTDVDLSDTPAVETAYVADSATYLAADGTTPLTLTAAQQTALADALALTPNAMNANNGSVGWDYSVGATDVDFLAAGETVELTYTATVDDGTTTATTDFTVTITGTNDAPMVTATNPVADTEGDSLNTTLPPEPAADDNVTVDFLADTVDGDPMSAKIIEVSDVDQSDEVSASVVSVTSTTSAAVLTAIGSDAAAIAALFDTSANDGTVTYNRNASAFDHLQLGQSITVDVVVDVTSGPDTVSRTVTLTIEGANDAPYFTNESIAFNGDVLEGTGAMMGVYNSSITIGYDDVELADTHNATVTAVTEAGVTPANTADYIGTFAAGFPSGATGAAEGQVLFDFTLNEAVIENLSADQTIVQKYSVSVVDNNGASVSQPITITIQGTNDGPVITAINDDTGTELTATALQLVEDEGTVESGSEDPQSLSGTIEFTDIDVNSLAAADGAADTHTITATLSTASIGGVDSTASLHETYTGGTITGPVPLSGGSGGPLTFPQTALTFDVAAANTAQTVANTADWTFTILEDGDFDFLEAGAELALTYTITVEDEAGGTSSQDITITITGTNDAPTLAAITPITVTDTAALDTFNNVDGTLMGDDVDDNPTLTYSFDGIAAVVIGDPAFTASVTDPLGTLFLNENTGAYRFVADADAVNALTASTDITFDLQVSDEDGATAAQTLTVTLAGANDTPVLGMIVNGTVSDTDADDTYADVTGSFTSTDVDTGKTATYSVVGQMIDGTQAGFDHAVSNPLGTLYFNETNGDYKFVSDDAAVEALDVNTMQIFAVTVTDNGGLTSTGNFQIDFTAVNDNPRGAADAILDYGTEDTDYTVLEADLLSGFADAEGQTLSVDAGTIMADNGATVAASANGFTVTPADDFNGTITLTYDVLDGAGGTLIGQTQTFHVDAVADPDMITSDTTLDDSVLDGSNLIIGTGIPGTRFAVAQDAVDAPDLEIGLQATQRISGGTFIDTDIDGDGLTYVVPSGAALGTPQESADPAVTSDDAYARWNFNISIGANIDDMDGTDGTIGDYDFEFKIESDVAGFTTIEFDSDEIVAGIAFVAAQAASDAGEDPAAAALAAVNAFLGASELQSSNNLGFDIFAASGFNPNTAGMYTVTVTAFDKIAGTEVLSNQIDIKVNEAPVAVADTIEGTEDTAIMITAADLLGNDTDANDDTLTIASVTGATGGTAVLEENGTVTFTPTPDFNGAAGFTYIASDGQLVSNLSGTGVVTINIAAVNDAPVNTIAALTMDEDTDLNLSGLSVTDVDAGANDITVTLSVASGEGTIAAAPAPGVGVTGDGTNAIVLTGTVDNINTYLGNAMSQPVFTPAQDLNGMVALTMTTNDGGNTGTGGALSDTDTVMITVNAVNDAPEAEDIVILDTPAISEDEMVIGTITQTPELPTDLPLSLFGSDVDGNIDLTSLALTGATVAGAAVTAAAAGVSYNSTTGALVFDATQTIYQNLDQGDDITVVVNFTITDSDMESDAGSVSFTLRGTNDAPEIADVNIGTITDTAANDLFAGVDIDGTSSTTITGAVMDVDEDATFTFTIDGQTLGMGDTSTSLAGTFGTLTLNDDGTYTYEADVLAVNASTPATGGAANPTDTFTIRVTDEFGGTDTATVTVDITPENDTPELTAPATTGAVTDTGGIADFDDVTGTLMASDRDAAGTPEGTLSFGLNDGVGVVGSQSFYYDRAGGTVTTMAATGLIALGTLTVETDGDYTFAPDNAGIMALRVGEVLTVAATVQVTDEGGASATQPLQITLTGGNNAPVAIDDSFGTTEGSISTSNNLLTIGTDDSDVDDDPISITNVADLNDTMTMAPLDSAVVNGAAGNITTDWGAEVSLQSNGQLSYNLTSGSAKFNELKAGATAVDTFSYTISDGAGGFDTATVSVTITGINDAIMAVADTISGAEDGAAEITGNLLLNDTDVDLDDTREIITVNSSTTATALGNGTGFIITTIDGVVINLDVDGSYTLTAPDGLDAGQTATAAFQYTVQDGGSESTTTVNVSITGDNDAPDAVAVTLTASDEDQVRTITAAELLVGASDADNNAVLIITDLSLTSGSGTLVDNEDGTWTYTPLENDNSAVTFSYTVDDGILTATSDATLDLLPVNDAAMISGDVAGAVTEDDTAILTTSGTLAISDVDAGEAVFTAATLT
ncbi:tandem-95 repeat protein, partial [uncultured Sulfitobacter sp.]|uniref:tandem-95 repeat protein n=1 Tax=uncultured Sulfitobacter sp. TaxID=191468 RepID=UPI002616104C